MKKVITEVCLSLAVIFALIPLPALAGVRNISPDQFDVSVVSDESQLEALGAVHRTKYFLSVKSGRQVAYEAEVKLPVGATITKFALNAEVNAGGGRVILALTRSRFGAKYTELISSINLDGVTNHGWHSTQDILEPKVSSGYRYWLWVMVEGYSGVYGAQVSYR